jgi:hypothetical protein
MSGDELNRHKLFAVHPAFRVIATGAMPTRDNQWLSSELIGAFHFVEVSMWQLLEDDDGQMLLSSGDPSGAVADVLCGVIGSALPREHAEKLELLMRRMRELAQDPLIQLTGALSMRQLLRIAKFVARYPDQLYETIFRNCLLQFMPIAKRTIVLDVLRELQIEPSKANKHAADVSSDGKKVTVR